MPKVTHAAFAGMRPGRQPELLAPGEAVLARNVRLNDGSIEPLPGLSAPVVTLASASQVKTLYRFGQLLASETLHWFETPNDADFVKGPIADDTEERTYITGLDVYPSKTNSSLGTGTAPKPTNRYRMGVVRPGGTPGNPEIASTFTPVGTVSGTGTGDNVTVIYAVTYVSSWGEESPPSRPSNAITYQPGQTITVTLPSAPTGNYSVAFVRLYRSNTGTNATQFQFVTEVAVGTTTYADTTPASALGEVIGSTFFTEPDDAMKGLTILPNGALMGFFENQLCFSEPGFPHAWPIRYRRSMAAPIVAVAALDSSVFVFTTRGTYVLTGTEPANMVESEAVIPHACVSKRSVRKAMGGVVFATKDGLYRATNGGVSNLTAPIMASEDWAAYAPSTILGLTTPNQYIGFFDTGTRQAGFVIRDEGGVTFTETDVFATAGFLETSTSTLFLVLSGNVVRKWEQGAALTSLWRSGIHREPAKCTFSAARVEASAYPVTFRFYADGVLKWTQTVADDRIFKLPGGYRSRKTYYEVEGTNRVTYVCYATSADLVGARDG